MPLSTRHTKMKTMPIRHHVGNPSDVFRRTCCRAGAQSATTALMATSDAFIARSSIQSEKTASPMPLTPWSPSSVASLRGQALHLCDTNLLGKPRGSENDAQETESREPDSSGMHMK